MSSATPTRTESPAIKIVSDGNPFNTQIHVDGNPLNNVMALNWEINTDGTSRMIVEFDWVSVEYEGEYVKSFTRPTLREVIGMWWRGRTRPNRDRL